MMQCAGESGLTLFLIDDEDEASCLLEFVLQTNGYRIIWSHNGRRARTLIATVESPDAVLPGDCLPDMTGLDLLAFLRTQSLWQTIPVAMPTARADSPDLRRATALGANDHIVKPVSPTRLAARWNHLLMRTSQKTVRVR